MPFLPIPSAFHRCVLVAVTLVPLLVVVLACVPALVVLPFLPSGFERHAALVSAMADWMRIAISHSGDQAHAGQVVDAAKTVTVRDPNRGLPAAPAPPAQDGS